VPVAESNRDGTYGLAVTLIGWGLAAASLFYFNRFPRWEMWFIYFFPHVYLGVIIHQALSRPGRAIQFWLYVALVIAALCWSWYLKMSIGEGFGTRWRLVITLACGLLLFAGGKLGFMETWPKSRLMGYLGRTSYSLFLVHFPVLVVVVTVWTWLEWRAPWLAAAGLAAAFVLSLSVSDLFYRAVENPSKHLSRRVKY
jgi:peptidoglycan/LPS O-acetylase OafA/YrhL